MLGLAAMVIPARATLSYYNGTSGNTQYNSAVVTAGLTPSLLETFGLGTGSFTAGNTEYDDNATGIKFFGFLSDGVTADDFLLFGTELEQHHGGDLLKIVLPANVFAFGADLGFTSASFGDICFSVGTFNPGCSGNQNAIWTSGNEFIGVTSDTAFTVVWVGPIVFNPILLLADFEDATGAAAPETKTVLTLGTGLVLLGLIKRGIRRRAAALSGQS